MHKRGKIIVTEYMENGSLRSLLNTRAITSAERVKISKDIALGLKYLHSQNILHRDLTSKNILLNKSMGAKVADFGLSKQKINGEELSFTMGSVPWMAPEVLLNPNNFVEKSDVFSYAIILWETWTRDLPCPDDVPHHHFARQVYAEQYRPPIPKDIPEKWIKLIQQCWCADPNERPKLIKIIDLILALENEIDSSPHSRSPRTNSSKKSGRNRLKESSNRLKVKTNNIPTKNKSSMIRIPVSESLDSSDESSTQEDSSGSLSLKGKGYSDHLYSTNLSFSNSSEMEFKITKFRK